MRDSASEEEKIIEAFTELSAQIISELIEEEPDVYTIEDVRAKYRRTGTYYYYSIL